MSRTLAAAIAIAALALAGCNDSPTRPARTPPSPYKDLTKPWHAVANLEAAYNNSDVDGYQENVFDADNFTFTFSTADFNAGITPESWGYDDEIQSATNIFTGKPDKNGEHTILRITVDLIDPESATWTDLPDPPGFPGETWKQTVINYAFAFLTDGNLTYISRGAPAAEFTVREVDGEWRLVDWVDLANSSSAAASPAATEEISWGVVKALYR